MSSSSPTTKGPILTISTEINYEDEAVNWNKNIKYARQRLEKIYIEWSYEVGNRFVKEKKDIKGVCGHIKSRLRVRGVSEGALDYVAECLEAKFKDSAHDGSANRTYGKDGKPSSPVYEDIDVKALNVHFRPDFEKMSQAELEELVPRALDLRKAMIKKYREECETITEIAKENQIKIPEVMKVSAPVPPDYFWGQSELYNAVMDTYQESAKFTNQLKDLLQRIWYFKPDKELATACADKWKEFHLGDFNSLRRVHTLVYKKYENILTPYTDLKWADNLTGWLQMANTRNTTHGNKGCGSKFADPTGLFILKTYKDGHQELVELDRVKTREQTGDKAKSQVVKIALVQVQSTALEMSLNKWYNETELIEEKEIVN